jgi:hypothetical protein
MVAKPKSGSRNPSVSVIDRMSFADNANIADAALIAQSPGLILGNSERVFFNPRTITVATFTDA